MPQAIRILLNMISKKHTWYVFNFIFSDRTWTSFIIKDFMEEEVLPTNLISQSSNPKNLVKTKNFKIRIWLSFHELCTRYTMKYINIYTLLITFKRDQIKGKIVQDFQ